MTLPFSPFNQPAPELGNQHDDDRVLRSYLSRVVPPAMLARIEPELRDLGELAGGELYRLQREDRENEPVHTMWSPWGARIDHIEITRVWKRAEQLAAERGIVATAYEQRDGALSRVHQFALAYLFTPSTDIYSCPLAMTDGAARTLLAAGNAQLVERALPRLTSRDPKTFWTSGQWMTESTGGSDVGRSETIAKKTDAGWRLYGRKWFTSATTSQMAITLARPEGNGPGGHGLAMFYLETRDSNGALRDIQVHRLKDKLGTRKVPTAELTLDGTQAELVVGTTDGTRHISPMLNVTRTWNGVSAIALMRRGLALARDYAKKRVAFGAPLSEKPLHVDTLAGLQAEFEAGFHLAFRVVELIGADETGTLDETGARLLRLVTPLMKLTTARMAVGVTSEVLEAFGGAGYVEDTGLPQLLRDGQVLSIWEGTTNVLSLDALKVIAKDGELSALQSELDRVSATVQDGALAECVSVARAAIDHARAWLLEARSEGVSGLEAGARRFALTLGRAYALLLLAYHAQWSLAHERDGRARAAAVRFSRTPIDLLRASDANADQALANDAPLPTIA